MAIKDALLPEFDHEMQVTRKVLARVPDEVRLEAARQVDDDGKARHPCRPDSGLGQGNARSGRH